MEEAPSIPETDAPASPFRWINQPGRETAVVTAFFLLLTLAIFLPVLLGPDRQVVGDRDADLGFQFVHWRQFGFGQMAAGHFPLWNPFIYGGTQYFGGFQSALLYPPNWLYLCLPLSLAINAGIALHVFFAGWFMYFWVRHQGVHVTAAVMAGMLFMLGGTYFLHIYAGHLPNLCTMVWGPLILLSIDGWFARRTMPSLLLGGGALAMQILAGHPQYVFYTAVACALYVPARWWDHPQRWRMAVGLAAIPLIGVTLSAVQVFEGLHAGAESIRSKGTSIAFSGIFSFPLENLLTFVAPGFFGDTVTLPYWGRHLVWEMCPYIGITGVVFAAYGLWRVRRRDAWVCAGLALVFLVLAFGRYTPLFGPIYHYAPGFNKFRGWSKFLYPAMLFTVMLSAIGFDALLRQEKASRRLCAAILGCGAVVGGAGFWACWSAHQGAADSPVPWEHWVEGLLYSGESMGPPTVYLQPAFKQAAAKFAGQSLLWSAGSFVALAAAFFASRRWRVALFAVPVIALAEMLLFALPTLVTFEFTTNRRRAVEESLNPTPLGDARLIDLAGANTGMSRGQHDVWGYDPGVTRRYAELIAVTQGLAPDGATQELRFKRLPDLYATLLRCRYAFGFPEEDTGSIMFYPYDPALVSPHAMLVPEVRLVPKGDNVLRAMASPFDPRRTVILESPPEPRPAEHPNPGKARVIEETTDSLTIEAETPDPAVLVITDAYSDGWKARSLLAAGEGGGQSFYHVMPADHCLRAIPLAAGRHRILLEYRPTAFMVGAWASALGVLAYLLAIGWWFRKSRQRADLKPA